MKSRSVHGFCDLNIVLKDRRKDSPDLKAMLMRLSVLGYRVAAVNTILDESIFETKEKERGKAGDTSDIVPPPLEGIDSLDCSTIQVFNRITVKVSEADQTHKLNQSKNLKEYDIFALIPTTTAVFQHICSSQNVDVISFEPGYFRCNRKMYNLAAEKGIYFEITYAPAITSSTFRKSVIAYSHICHEIGRSRNVFISSCADNPSHLRNAYDIVNLGLLFGLSPEQAKQSITSTCRSLLIRAEGRRCGKCVMFITNRAVKQHLTSMEEDREAEEHLPKKKKREDTKGFSDSAVPMEPCFKVGSGEEKPS